MVHFLLLFTILSYFTGAVNILFLALMHARTREPVQRWSILFQLPFTLYMTMYTIERYGDVAGFDVPQVVWLPLLMAATVSMLVILPAYSRVLSELQPWTGITRVFAACAVVYVTAVGMNMLNITPGGPGTTNIIMWVFIYACIAYSAGLGVYMGFSRRKEIRKANPAQKAAVIMAVAALVLYLPYRITAPFLYEKFPFVNSIPDFQCLYLAWNLLLIRGYLLEFLRSRPPVRDGAGADPPASGVPDASIAGSLRESCRSRFGISDRECEVLVLLSEGRSYREIADRLCISLATVKTHINRIYRKTGSANKVELIRTLERR